MIKRLFIIAGLLLFFASCSSEKPAAPPPPPKAESNAPVKLDEALSIAATVQVSPAPGASGGAYIVTEYGVWYVREGLAVKVKEVDKMPMSVKDINEPAARTKTP